MGIAIDERARIEAKDQDRPVAEGAKERERQGRVVRKLEHEPGAGHRLHPGADERHRLPGEIAAKLGVLERGNLHDRATARLDSSRSGDGVQFTCVRQSSDGGEGLATTLPWLDRQADVLQVAPDLAVANVDDADRRLANLSGEARVRPFANND